MSTPMIRPQRRRRPRGTGPALVVALVAAMLAGLGVHAWSAEADPPAAPTPPAGAHPAGAHAAFAPEDLPAGDPGTAEHLVETDPQGIPPSSGGGSFRVMCDFTHMNNDDPIVFPGQQGAAHLHSFFGNTSTDAATDPATLSGTGNSACDGGTANRSAYWAPTMLDADGRPVKPVHSGDWVRGVQLGYFSHPNVFYYKTFADRDIAITAPPPGFRMIAGNARATNRAEQEQANPQIGFHCEGGDGGSGDRPGEIPVCDRDQLLTMSIGFPDCWDGVNLDSPDHRSHVALGGARCPDSHPVRIPSITMNVRWPVWDHADTRGWRLASDTYDAAAPGGFSAHADWINGWDQAVFEDMVQHCLTERRECEVDRLGQGQVLGPRH